MAECVERLLKLKSFLPAIWDPHKFLASEGGPGEGEMDAETKSKLNIPLLTRTIGDKAWWGFATMISKLHNGIGKLSGWCESCPCHDWLRSSDGRPEADWPQNIVRFQSCREWQGLGKGEGDGHAFQCPRTGVRALQLFSDIVLQTERRGVRTRSPSSWLQRSRPSRNTTTTYKNNCSNLVIHHRRQLAVLFVL